MRRLLPSTISFLLAGASLGLIGCADNDSGLFVRAVLAVQAPECAVKADPTSLHLMEGVLDVSLRDQYDAALLVGNQLVRRGDRDQLRTETSRITLEGAEVAVLDQSGNSVGEFSVPGTGFVDPGTSDDPGYGAMSTTLIPPGMGASGSQMVVEVRVFGTTLGGDEIESAKLTYPITVCSGCLVSQPLEATDPATGGCLATTGQDLPDLPCRVGQDDFVDCRLLNQTTP
jgi:hypothetical protein